MSTQNRAFRVWVNGAGLIDLGHQGPAYTWCNNQQGRDMICQRLDRALSNLAWSLQYPETTVFHIPRFQSDHHPILIRTKPTPLLSRRKFRSENWWLSAEGFDGVCDIVGQGAERGWKETHSVFKKTANQWVKRAQTPNQMLAQIEKEAKEVDLILGGDIHRRKEKELQVRHERALAMHEQFYHQRSRIKWAACGDRNSAFFHATAVTRKRKNAIRSIMVEEGRWETEEKKVREAFLDYFRSIYRKGERAQLQTTFDPELIASFPKISSWAYSRLESVPSSAEIQKALFSLGPDKAAGPDGINARLLQDKWAQFGPAVISEVTAFFQTGLLSSFMGRSNLILVPKKEEPKLVTDFRPISVCNTIYKVISKILALRLRQFIPLLISNSQAAFVPSRKISQNIILLKEVLHSF